MRLTRAFLWECLQNLPLAGGIVYGLSFTARDELVLAAICILGGAGASAILIRLSEPKISGDRPEPWRVSAANFASFALLMLATAAYLAATEPYWWLDVVVGGTTGAVASAVQAFAAREPTSAVHAAALGGGTAGALFLLRQLRSVLPDVVTVVTITVCASLIIAVADYGHLSTMAKGSDAPSQG